MTKTLETPLKIEVVSEEIIDRVDKDMKNSYNGLELVRNKIYMGGTGKKYWM